MTELKAVAGSDNVFRDLGFPEAEAQNLLLRGDRTYYVSDERLRAFAQLSYAQRLQWVEQCSQFVRLAQMAKAKLVADRVDHVQGAKPVFNLAVGLKNLWGK